MGLSRVYKRMDRLQNGIAKAEKAFGIFAMAFIIVINIYGISSRYIFDQPVIYVQELTILGAVWIFFIGMGLIFKVRSDITVGFFVQLLPKRMQLLDGIVVAILCQIFLVVLAWQTWKFIPFTRGTSHVLSFALELPDEIYYYPVGLGAISIFLTVFQDFVRRLTRLSDEWEEHPIEDKGGH